MWTKCRVRTELFTGGKTSVEVAKVAFGDKPINQITFSLTIKFLQSIFGTRTQAGLQKIHNTIVAIQNTLFTDNAKLFSKVNSALKISSSI